MQTKTAVKATCKRVALLLKTERERKTEDEPEGLSMTVLAKRAGLSQPSISYIERSSRRSPNLETLLLICGALGVEPFAIIVEATKPVSDRANRIIRHPFHVPTKAAVKAICKRVALLVKTERERKPLSMTVLAERTGLSQPSISYIERSKRVPNLETLLLISDALGIELSVILAEATKPAKQKRP